MSQTCQLTIEAASYEQRMTDFLNSYPTEWAGKTKLVKLPHTDTMVQHEAVIIGSTMQGMYDLAEAIYGEPAFLYGPVARAKEQPADRYFTIMTRRISRVGRRKAVAGAWGYYGIESSLAEAIDSLPVVRSGAYTATILPA